MLWKRNHGKRREMSWDKQELQSELHRHLQESIRLIQSSQTVGCRNPEVAPHSLLQAGALCVDPLIDILSFVGTDNVCPFRSSHLDNFASGCIWLCHMCKQDSSHFDMPMCYMYLGEHQNGSQMDVHPKRMSCSFGLIPHVGFWKNVLQSWTHPHMLDSGNSLQTADGKQHCATSTKALQLFIPHPCDPHVIGELCIRRVALHRALGCIDQHFNHWHRSNATAVRFQSKTRNVRFVNVVKDT